jgi:hypothetical protein
MPGIDWMDRSFAVLETVRGDGERRWIWEPQPSSAKKSIEPA